MRLSLAAAALSLVLSAVADVGGRPPPNPPDSVCNFGPEYTKKRKEHDRIPDSDLESSPAAIVVERQERGLGVTSLPRHWARDLLSSVGGEPVCRGLRCACVEPYRKGPYGFFKKGQCPDGHGAYSACNLAEDGHVVSLAPLRQIYLGSAVVVDTVDSATSGATWPPRTSTTRSARRTSQEQKPYAHPAFVRESLVRNAEVSRSY